MALDHYADSKIVCCDVSTRFLEVCCTQLASYGSRLEFGVIGAAKDSFKDQVLRYFEAGTVDMVYSIDALVHVDQHMFVNYLVAAHDLLRTGGKFCATLACLDGELGALHLIARSNTYYENPNWGGRMVYYSHQGLTELCRVIGFRVSTALNLGRDIGVVFTKL